MEISLKEFFLLSPIPFTKKRDLNWFRILCSGGIALTCLILFLLFFGKSDEINTSAFHEKIIENGSGESLSEESNPLDSVQSGNYQESVVPASVHSSLDYLSIDGGAGGGQSSEEPQKQNAAMIIPRSGGSNTNQLPAGSKINVVLKEGITLRSDGIAVIAIVLEDVLKDQSVAIPNGSQIIGDASFNGDDRANIIWKSLIYPSGREREISATSMDSDGHVGISGNIKSDALKNSLGQTMTRFIGAYAEGSISRGAFGASSGGNNNGIKNAIAETSKDRADEWAQDLSKERKWIELKSGTKFFAVLTQSFSFRDPGHLEGGQQ